MKINVTTLGCPKNIVDSEYLAGQLVDKHVQFTDEAEAADVVIINTCAFILPAREEAIEAILEAVALKNSGSAKRIYVTGCLPQRYREALEKEIPEVDGFFPGKDFREIGREIGRLLNCETHNFPWQRLIQSPNHYAYLKISEGCDNRCLYCSIPLIKGNYQSKPLTDLVVEAERLVDHGVKELILVAQDTTYYGWDNKDRNALPRLIKSLTKIAQLKWIRILYTHPAHLTERFIKLFGEEEKLCRYIDMPIQHISDKVLKAMGRSITEKEIRKKIADLRAAEPEIGIRTTFMVGYPGETDEDFQLLKNFVAEAKFERLGVFKFLPEEGTKAAFLNHQIENELQEARYLEIMETQYKISEERNRQFLDQTVTVLVDEKDETDNYFLGRTEWDSPQIDNLVHVRGDIQIGEFFRAKIERTDVYDLWAKKVD